MKKLILLTIAAFAVIGLLASTSFALVQPYAVSATRPTTGGSVELKVHECTTTTAGTTSTTTCAWTTNLAGNNLNFGNLTYDSAYGVFYTPKSFVIEAAHSWGEVIDATLTYSDAATNGIGNRATVSLTKARCVDGADAGTVCGDTPTEYQDVALTGMFKTLAAVGSTGTPVDESLLTATDGNGNYYLRAYIGFYRGVATGDPVPGGTGTATPIVTTAANSTAGTTYSGTLTFTATVD